MTKYSDHIALPIYMKEMPSPAADDKDKKKPEELGYETVNTAKHYGLDLNDITDEEYKEFYKSFLMITKIQWIGCT